MQVTKSWKRRLRKWRNRMAKRFLATRIGREMLVNAVSPKILSMTADCGDHLMTFSPHDYIGRKIYRKGHFQRENVERLLSVLRQRNLLQPEKVLLELGGNIGTQTVYFALSKAFRHIVTVEPDPRNFKLLRTNIDQNGLASKSPRSTPPPVKAKARSISSCTGTITARAVHFARATGISRSRFRSNRSPPCSPTRASQPMTSG
jgi:hypothetical protein